MTRLLWVTDEVPDADLGGGNIRQFHLLRRVAERVETDLLLVGKLRDDELRRRLSRVSEIPLPPEPSPPSRWRRRLDDLRLAVGKDGDPSDVRAAHRMCTLLRAHLDDASQYDIVQIEHEMFAPLLPATRPPMNRWVITLHNLMSVRSRQRAHVSDRARLRWLFERDALQAERFERRIVSGFDRTIVMSDEDAAVLGGPSGRVVVVPNGVDVDRFSVTPIPSAPRLLFSASFNWEPNVDGAQWFAREVFPRLRERLPGATLVLVGRNPDPRVLALGGLPGVETHFDVPSVVPFLQSARVTVVPVRIGSGTRLKALEAIAAGRPVTGTVTGLEGIGLRDGVSAVISDDVDQLVAGLVRLCTDDAYAQAMTRAARPLVLERFSWDTIAERYLTEVLADRPTSQT